MEGIGTHEEKPGLTCPPDSAPAPAEVLAGVRWRGEEEEEEGKERRRVSGSDRQQSWQQHFLRWAILNSLSTYTSFKVQRGGIRSLMLPVAILGT